MQLCVDAKTDKILNDKFSGASGDACSKRDVKASGDTITVDSVCNFGAGTTTSHTVVTGSFERAYTMRITSTRQGEPQTPGTTPGQATQMTVEAKWLGACKAEARRRHDGERDEDEHPGRAGPTCDADAPRTAPALKARDNFRLVGPAASSLRAKRSNPETRHQ
jgi:hypothetical protein